VYRSTVARKPVSFPPPIAYSRPPSSVAFSSWRAVGIGAASLNVSVCAL
jgi:hypothetical protein